MDEEVEQLKAQISVKRHAIDRAREVEEEKKAQAIAESSGNPQADDSRPHSPFVVSSDSEEDEPEAILNQIEEREEEKKELDDL